MDFIKNPGVHLKRRSWPVIAALLAGLALCVHAADFTPPAPGPVAFRRDKVPLAAWTMAGLSRNLETIAQALPGRTAAQRQAAARALALSIALDPDNEGSRKLLDVYQNGGRAPEPDATRLAESQARIWQLIAWLETAEAGEHGQALASCLQDVMVVADPEHPRVAALRGTGDKGAWTGWVPGISAYESRKVAVVPNPAPAPLPPEESSKTAVVLLRKASLQTVFMQRKKNSWSPGPVSLFMSANPNSDPADTRFSVWIGSEHESEPMAQAARVVLSAVEKQHPVLPRGVTVQIRSAEVDRAALTGRIPEITAAAAVLASAAVTGREPEGTIIGQVDESGAFKLPPRFWDQLQALGPDNGRRLLLPAAVADWLPAFLAMENPGFFMDHEVLLAADFRHLLELSAKSPEGAVADAEAKFREIRERGEGQDIRTYLANRYVRQRLEELVKTAPFHASAAMLLLQGSVDRPREMSRLALASELRRAIEPMAWVNQLSHLEPTSKEAAEFNAIYKTCRLDVDRLERQIAKTDLDLWEGSRELTAALWRLNRAVRARGDYYVVQAEIQTALKDFKRRYGDISEQLNREAGDATR